MFIKSLN